MKLWKIMNRKQYHRMVAEKYIRVNKHPILDLYILNYTEKAQFNKVWNKVTLRSRGLIIDGDYNVIARPFDKFFNYGENQADIFLNDYAVEVTDKMDGSLGILWNYQDQQGIATRGSFTSDQAIHATEIWNEKYGFKVSADWTYLFEIVYPENRIVLDYGDTDDLILLGVRDIVEGDIIPAERVYTWRGPRTTTYPFASLSEALAAPSRDNAEGYVVYFPDLDYRVKIKQEDYVQLHKIVTGLTERRIWENMKAGKTLDDLIDIIPDEWHDWLGKIYGSILLEWNILLGSIYDDYEDLNYGLMGIFGMSWSRKDFALEAKKYPHTGFMFMLLDNKNIEDKVWDLVRPSSE